ncbi:hypothetical protein J6590_018747 [Homalodisca vitripennis]|nr:hypothetical protein J6590_018747 [Homalodisca vitripennis]
MQRVTIGILTQLFPTPNLTPVYDSTEFTPAALYSTDLAFASGRFLARCAALQRPRTSPPKFRDFRCPPTDWFLPSSTRDSGLGLFTRGRDESHSRCGQIP